MPKRKDKNYKYMKDTNTKHILLKLTPEMWEKLGVVARVKGQTRVAWLRERIEKAR